MQVISVVLDRRLERSGRTSSHANQGLQAITPSTAEASDHVGMFVAAFVERIVRALSHMVRLSEWLAIVVIDLVAAFVEGFGSSSMRSRPAAASHSNGLAVSGITWERPQGPIGGMEPICVMEPICGPKPIGLMEPIGVTDLTHEFNPIDVIEVIGVFESLSPSPQASDPLRAAEVGGVRPQTSSS